MSFETKFFAKPIECGVLALSGDAGDQITATATKCTHIQLQAADGNAALAYYGLASGEEYMEIENDNRVIITIPLFSPTALFLKGTTQDTVNWMLFNCPAMD